MVKHEKLSRPKLECGDAVCERDPCADAAVMLTAGNGTGNVGDWILVNLRSEALVAVRGTFDFVCTFARAMVGSAGNLDFNMTLRYGRVRSRCEKRSAMCGAVQVGEPRNECDHVAECSTATLLAELAFV